MGSPRLLAFAGSTRTGSYNKKLVALAAAGARAEGAEVTLVDLRDYPLPLFDEDLEAESGMPSNGRALKELFLASDGLLLSAPEYNSSITGVLKNTLDWMSRAAPGEKPFAPFADRVAGLMAASPGALGGLRGLVHVRAILANLQYLVLPQQVAVMKAHEAFGEDGRLLDARQQAAVEKLGAAVAATAARLRG